MKNYRRYKNAKIETLCQMEVVKHPQPAPLSESQKWLMRMMANCPGNPQLMGIASSNPLLGLFGDIGKGPAGYN